MKTGPCLLALAALVTIANADGSLRSQIESFDKPVADALKHKDIAAFAKLTKNAMTPDFKYSDDGSKPMDYKTMVAGMKQGLGMYSKITDSWAKVVSVKEHGSTATAVEKHYMAGLTTGRDKKPHKMAYEGTSIETFRKVHGVWKMSSMSMKTDKMTMDGKPVPMGNSTK